MSTISLIFSSSSAASSMLVFKGVLGSAIIPLLAHSRTPNGSTSFKKAEIRVGLAESSTIQLVSLMSTTRPPKLLVKLVTSFKCSCFNLKISLAGKLAGWNCFSLISATNSLASAPPELVEVWWCNSRSSKYSVPSKEILAMTNSLLMISELV
uniref:Uncharacterized protein n=1 Tax=Saccharomyces pastorianus TaxID=27292 RepID=P78994_SACPS|nr:unknown [Saccharomyces pastorianus]